MYQQREAHASATRRHDRRTLLKGGLAAGVGLMLAGRERLTALADASASSTSCTESVQQIVNTALTAERLAMTFYYTGLTTRAIVATQALAGLAGNPNAVSANGNPAHVTYLQAALDQEQQHARLLEDLGATSPAKAFHFPVTTFKSLGYTSHTGTFLWVLDHLETAFIGAYAAAAQRLGELGQVDLAIHALRIMGVECEHRALYRVLSADDPADNLTLEVASFGCVANAGAALAPFVTGQGFPHGATTAIAVPTPRQTARVIGTVISG